MSALSTRTECPNACTCSNMQMDRNNQLFMENVTEFSFTVCCCDWQLTTDYLNSPAVTSTHLAPCAAQNKHLEIPANCIWPTYTSRCSLYISTRWLKSTIFDSSSQTAACQSAADPRGSYKLFTSDLYLLCSGCKENIIVLFQCLHLMKVLFLQYIQIW